MNTSFERLKLDEHLGLYAVFHHSKPNRIVHGIFVPVVLFTGQLLFSFLRFQPGSAWLHFGTFATLAVTTSLAWIDTTGALYSLAWLLPLSGAAGYLSLNGGWTLALAVFLGHLIAWFMITIIGHEVLEPSLVWNGMKVDSNHYFRHGYFIGSNLGVRPTVWDRLAQFNISPMAITFEALFALGFLPRLNERVEESRIRVLSQLSNGREPFHIQVNLSPPQAAAS